MITIEPKWLSCFEEFRRFQEFFDIEGEIAKEFQNRRVSRFVQARKVFYIKCHWGIGWKEILISLGHGRKPVLGAREEWQAIHKLDALGVGTMEAVAFGEQGLNPATRRSFLITRDLGANISLEKLTKPWRENPPSATLKRKLINQVADIGRRLHDNGVNHRDFYLCHFLLDLNDGDDSLKPDNLTLNLIDLHRTQIRDRTPERWRVKDVGSLYFSALDIGLTQKDVLRFVRQYSGKPLRQTLTEDREFWDKVKVRADKLYRKTWDKPAEFIL